MTSGDWHKKYAFVVQVTCKEPYEWTDSTEDEWEFSPAARNTNDSKPFHVRGSHNWVMHGFCVRVHYEVARWPTQACAIEPCVAGKSPWALPCDSAC